MQSTSIIRRGVIKVFFLKPVLCKCHSAFCLTNHFQAIREDLDMIGGCENLFVDDNFALDFLGISGSKKGVPCSRITRLLTERSRD